MFGLFIEMLLTSFVVIQLAESSVALSLSGSEYVREIADAHEQTSHMVDVSKYDELEAELVATQRRLSESETMVKQRAAETSKLLISE